MTSAANGPDPRKGNMKRLLPWLVVIIFLAYVAVAIVRPIPSTSGFDTTRFGRLPVWLNGRIQPVDSVARLALLQIRGTVTIPEDGYRSWRLWKRTASLGATDWLLETLAKPDTADTRGIFRIDDARVRTAALEGPQAASAAMYYSFKDLQPRVKAIGEQVARAWKVKPADRTASDRAWLKLRDDLVLYERLKNTLQPNSFLQGDADGKPIAYDFGAELSRYEADLRAAIAARREGKMAPQGFAGLPQQAAREDENDKSREERVGSFVRPYVAVARAALLSLIPPADPERGRDRWVNPGAALVGSARTGALPAPLSFFARMSTAYATGNADEFNRQLASYEKWLAARGLRDEARRASTEFFYNSFQPFVRATAIYLIVLLLAVGSTIRRSPILYRCSAMVLAVAAALHMTGIVFDMMLQGTLPITNVYSTIISAGGVGVLLSAALERRYRNGICLIAAATIGISTIAGAHSIAPGGAITFAAEVLDAGFWLAAIATLLTLWLASVRSGVRAAGRNAVRSRWMPASVLALSPIHRHSRQELRDSALPPGTNSSRFHNF
jgi:hypothetical protein